MKRKSVSYLVISSCLLLCACALIDPKTKIKIPIPDQGVLEIIPPGAVTELTQLYSMTEEQLSEQVSVWKEAKAGQRYGEDGEKFIEGVIAEILAIKRLIASGEADSPPGDTAEAPPQSKPAPAPSPAPGA